MVCRFYRIELRELTVRLPQYQIGVLQVLADDGRESVDTMLTRMFEELTDVNHQRLARLIPGLAEAIAWPDAVESDRACRPHRLEVMRNVLTLVRRHPPCSRSQPSARRRVRKATNRPVAVGRQPQTRPARAPYVLTLSARRIARPNRAEAVVPYLRMSGRWLEEHGFGIGSVVQVRVEHGRVTLISDTTKA
jgi:hypothetical protein